MSWQVWTFTLLDTGFFRDGQPFNAGEGGYSRVQASFPPNMVTLQGAIRTALASAAGWRPGAAAAWPSYLGGADNLGQLTLRGPYLLRGDQAYFPMPLHLLAKERSAKSGEKKWDFALLTPGDPVACDLGAAIRLPRVAGEGFAGGRAPDGLYVNREGLEAVLGGSVPQPEQVEWQGELWAEEARIGLERRDATRTALEGQLYQAVHVRPRQGVAVRALVGGLPQDRQFAPPGFVLLGGEGRAAAVKVQQATDDDLASLLPSRPPLAPDQDGTLRFTLTLITSGYYADPAAVIRRGPPGVPGTCVSACIGKLRQIGGWNLEEGRPRSLEPVLPAGSTWFFEGSGEDLAAVAALHGRCLGDKPEYGHGQVVVGKWERRYENE